MFTVNPGIKNAFDTLLKSAPVQAALKYLEEDAERCKEEQKTLVLIETPTGHEENRAAAFLSLMEKSGLPARKGSGGNVLAFRPGLEDSAPVLVEGHLDTVFPFGTVREVIEKDNTLYAPGIGDDTRALAMVLSLARALEAARIRTVRPVLLAATTREEGEGALGGIRDLLDECGLPAAAVHLDNHNMAKLLTTGTITETWEFTVHGRSGHAYGAFGSMPNALHACARAVATIADIEVPADPKTTFCVSNFHAGNRAGAHAFAPEAKAIINFRSGSEDAFALVKTAVFAAFDEAVKKENARWGGESLTVTAEPVCLVPGGTEDVHSPLPEAAFLAAESRGVKPVFLGGGTTNANITLSRGVPAVCLGRGFVPVDTRTHSESEFFPLEGAYKATQSALLTLLMAAGVEDVANPVV